MLAVFDWQFSVKAASVQIWASYVDPFGFADGSVQLTCRLVANTFAKVAEAGAIGVVVNELGVKFNVEEHPDVSVNTITRLG